MESAILLFVIIICVVSYQAFKNLQFYEQYLFEVDAILVRKEYIRMVSSGFLHANLMHLGFNMIALYSFGISVGSAFGLPKFFFIYFVSLLAGNALALYIHRNHGGYRAVGASGAISGVVYASIALFPQSKIGLILLPPFIPAWLFGILFLMVSMYGIKSQRDNIGHEAHLGGALAGMLLAIAIEPSVLVAHSFFIFIMLIPTLFFLYMVVRRPEMLHVDNFFKTEIEHFRNRQGKQRSSNRPRQRSHTYTHRESPTIPPGSTNQTEQAELDSLLDKVTRKGLDSLTEEEKKRLEDLSRKL
ncbi:MAG: rhomboid family intramembrane serine protease [Chitinophagales bacterium]